MYGADRAYRPVDDAAAVEVLQAAQDLSRVETTAFLVKFAGRVEMLHQVASIEELHDVK